MLKLMDIVWITVILSLFGENFDQLKFGWYLFTLWFAVMVVPLVVMDKIISIIRPGQK